MKEETALDRDQIRAEVREELEKEFVTNIEEYKKKLEADNKVMITAALEEWKKEQTPPTTEEIGQLLNQEYKQFVIKLPWENAEEKEFTVRELPISVEKRFYRLIKEKLLPKLKDFSLLELEGEDVETKAKSLFELIDPAMDLLSEAAVLVLNPKGKLDWLTSDWVKDNMSSFRIWNLLLAQVEANRMRDFFSGVSRISQSGKMRPVGTLN